VAGGAVARKQQQQQQQQQQQSFNETPHPLDAPSSSLPFSQQYASRAQVYALHDAELSLLSIVFG
jgi:hypothetical protein